MELAEIIEFVAKLALAAQKFEKDGNHTAAYCHLDSLHDFMTEHFDELPFPSCPSEE